MNYNRLQELRSVDTGIWFLKSQMFSNWKISPGSLLWLYGIPGCGKSVLSSTIIEAINSHSSSESDWAVLYFFFDFNDEKKQQTDKMVQSLTVQLSSQNISVPQSLLSLYKSCANGERQPAYHSLVNTLHEMLAGFNRTYIVLDALDECEKWPFLLSLIEKLASWRDLNLHILVTSRKERDIEELIEPLTNFDTRICIQSSVVNRDIQAYIQVRLQTGPKFKRWRERPEVLIEVEEKLMEKADGMYFSPYPNNPSSTYKLNQVSLGCLPARFTGELSQSSRTT